MLKRILDALFGRSATEVKSFSHGDYLPLSWSPDYADRPMYGERPADYRKLSAEDVRRLLNCIDRYHSDWRVIKSVNGALPCVGFLEDSWYGLEATDERILAWWMDYVNDGVGLFGVMCDGWLSGKNYGDC